MGGFFHAFALRRQPSHVRQEAPKCHDWRLFPEPLTACEGRGWSGPAQIGERCPATPPRLDLKVARSDIRVDSEPARHRGDDPHRLPIQYLVAGQTQRGMTASESSLIA